MHDKAFPSYGECSSEVLHYHQNAAAQCVIPPRTSFRPGMPLATPSISKTSPGGGRGGGWRKTTRSRADDDVGVCWSHVSFSSIVCLSPRSLPPPLPGAQSGMESQRQRPSKRRGARLGCGTGRPGNRTRHCFQVGARGLGSGALRGHRRLLR